MKRLKELIKENENLNEFEDPKTALLNSFLKGKIDLDALIKKAGGLDKVATKEELQSFLKNGFMISVMASEHGIKKDQLIKKVKELLTNY